MDDPYSPQVSQTLKHLDGSLLQMKRFECLVILRLSDELEQVDMKQLKNNCMEPSELEVVNHFNYR